VEQQQQQMVDDGDDTNQTGNHDNNIPLHGLEELHLSNCELPAMDMITQWMARCPKLKRLSGRRLDFYDDPSMMAGPGLPLVSINEWRPYSENDYIQAPPLIHINAPHHQLEFVSLEDIRYHSVRSRQYGLLLSAVVEQLWRSPNLNNGYYTDRHLDYYWAFPSTVFYTDPYPHTGALIQSPEAYVKLTCQSLDNFVW
jgi:hypothetical protein